MLARIDRIRSFDPGRSVFLTHFGYTSTSISTISMAKSAAQKMLDLNMQPPSLEINGEL